LAKTKENKSVGKASTTPAPASGIPFKKGGKKLPKGKKKPRTVKETIEREQTDNTFKKQLDEFGDNLLSGKKDKVHQAIPITEFKAKPEVDAYWDKLLLQILNGNGHFKFVKNEIPASIRPSDGHKIYQKHGL
jgi:hypothetical protein